MRTVKTRKKQTDTKKGGGNCSAIKNKEKNGGT